MDGGAFVPGPRMHLAPTRSGTLDGLRFAVKDLIDVAGSVTGGGNPDWARTHAPAARHAHVVARLLDTGAALCGKTITDELAFSLEGENWHYGTPVNPRCPDCLPGGSSSGSAVAVAAGLADFALGTDTGGSVRVPAAFCGVPALRPTHGAISLDGVLPFAPSYDTIGIFAQSVPVLGRVAAALLPRPASSAPIPRYLLARDAFALADGPLRRHLAWLTGDFDAAPVDIFDGGLERWLRCYAVCQGGEIRQSLGPWIHAVHPRFGPAIAPRFAGLDDIAQADIEREATVRALLRAGLDALLPPGAVLLVPTTPRTALPRNASGEERAAFYQAALAINAIAGHAGLPQLTLPAGTVDGKPVALSFIAARHADALLLSHAPQWQRRIDAGLSRRA
ncbi:amidase [Noviherbaspirillum sp. DKR-6]|uniref:Amidase n=2 Tax=Noviherbaspirillum pedocola TaxID=2801341 RepID=A0A934STF6_9BURK|nr:amidase [Noviherbaspirillum pedocola]